MFETVKLALRVSTDAFDEEIRQYIDDCLLELVDMHIIDDVATVYDNQITTAVIAYCKWHFGENDQSAKWQEIYERKVARLLHTHNYGLRGDGCGQI